MVPVAVHVEQARAGSLSQCAQRNGVTALADVDYAFEDVSGAGRKAREHDQVGYGQSAVSGGTGSSWRCTVLANLFGMDDIWVVLIAIVVLFGGSQLPKLARNAGEAMKEFRKGHDEASAISAQPSGAAGAAGGGATAPVALPSAPAQPQQATGGAEDHVTLTRSELDALLADREACARAGKQDHQGPEN